MFGIIQGLSMVVYAAVLTFYGKRYGFSRIKSMITGVIMLIVEFTFIFILTWMESGFKQFGAQNAVRVFVMIPLFALIIGKVAKMDVRKLLDYYAAPTIVWFAVGHIACIPAGCCHGFEYFEGTTAYNVAQKLTGTNMLPVQLFECIAAFLLAGILFAIARKYKYNFKGYLMYIMLILYGTQRFFWEFLRDNDKVIVFDKLSSADGEFGISNLALWALAMVIEGAVLLAITVYKDKKKNSLPETQKA